MENNLKKIRNSRKLAQQNVCDELKKHGLYITRSTYAKYETGDRNISCEILCALADVFETTTDYILKRQH